MGEIEQTEGKENDKELKKAMSYPWILKSGDVPIIDNVPEYWLYIRNFYAK